MRLRFANSRGDTGFTMIEVLITVFVLGLGMLAVASLQATAKQVNHEAAQRTAAASLAQSMVEMLRANRDVADNYLTSNASAIESAPDCLANSCIPAELADYDRVVWADALDGSSARIGSDNVGGLVNPTGCITAGAQPNVYHVAIAWRGITALPAPDASVPADDPSRNPCGQGLSLYDDPQSSGNDDLMRRVMVVDAIIEQ